MELHEPEEFERRIFVKAFDPVRFREELRKVPVGETVAIGTATDPYQPAERRYRVTRRMLEVLASTNGLKLGITTKSDLIARDADLLAEVAARHYLSIHATVTTVDVELSRLIEPYTPRPDLRLKAVRTLTSRGIRVMVFCAPVLPLINDSEASLDALARAAAEAGACVFGANVLFLMPSAQKVFLPFLEERFPALVKRYRERFERAAYLRGAYPDLIRERVARVRKRYGLQAGTAAPIPKLWPTTEQLDLFV
jgi:DNA repair photolyase